MKAGEKYYYSVNDQGTCFEKCNVKNDGTMIGSVMCKRCEHCMGYRNNKDWIICKQIKEATNANDTCTQDKHVPGCRCEGLNDKKRFIEF